MGFIAEGRSSNAVSHRRSNEVEAPRIIYNIAMIEAASIGWAYVVDVHMERSSAKKEGAGGSYFALLCFIFYLSLSLD